MLRVILLAAPLAIAGAQIALPASAAAQAQAQTQGGRQCDQSAGAQTRRSVMGGVLGGLAGGLLGRSRVGSAVQSFLPVNDLLSDAIMNLLDCQEQQKAAEATNQAIRGGVGTTSNWSSETRPGVTGTSTATADERLADGTHCVTVTDVVIVDGEETQAPKRMCRGPGQRGYARV